jgi:hypothetical protein
MPVGSWERLAVPGLELEEGEPAVLVFCGTYQRDSAALIACTVEREVPHVQVLGLWERPAGMDETVTVPAGDVDATVRAALRKYEVESFIVDLPGWEDEADEWDERYGSVVSFPLEKSRRTRMVAAGARFFSLVQTGGLTHDGHPLLARQLAQVTSKETPDGVLLGRPLGTDKRPAVGKYIDGAMAAVLAVDEAAEEEASVYETRGLLTLEAEEPEEGEMQAVTIEGETIYVRRAS